MRLWSIHPKYLDSKGLLGLWREALLAKKILQKKTKSYQNHPQMNRFKFLKTPVPVINTYLKHIYLESCNRGYCFNKRKLGRTFSKTKLKINKGQIEYEFNLLKNKLSKRAKDTLNELKKVKLIEPNPLFKIIKGKIESWERI